MFQLILHVFGLADTPKTCYVPGRLEEEMNSMENTNTELKNVINTLNNEREALLEQVCDCLLCSRLKDYPILGTFKCDVLFMR